MLSKVKLVAKNVIYLKGWSNENLIRNLIILGLKIKLPGLKII